MNRTIKTTMPAHMDDCCGCIHVEYVPDEEAWALRCNECGTTMGWGKTEWGSADDQRRLTEATFIGDNWKGVTK